MPRNTGDSKRQNLRNMADAEASAEAPACNCRSHWPAGNVPRRDFLKVSGMGLVGTFLAGSRAVMAGEFSPDDLHHDQLVPADKRLKDEWVQALFDRGEKEVFHGPALDNIGMPCGGIGSGQLYLCGDGTLGSWQIFNHATSNWVGQTHATYDHRGFAKPVEQGFSVAIATGQGQPIVRTLNRTGFSTVTFNGQYPIGTVRYEDDEVPARVTMEAFSPFIPMNMKDSGLPVTMFHITVENRSDQTIHASVNGWLENAVCGQTGPQLKGTKVTQISRKDGRGMVGHHAEEDKEAMRARSKIRVPIVFADFESGDYQGWTVQGEAFGKAPATGTLVENRQNPVSQFEGNGLVNSFLGGDGPTGKLVSKSFMISRRFINLKVGGGDQRGKTCVNLVVDGKVNRTATGRNTEKLAWASWHVEPLEGKEAHVEIIDEASGGWGHILADQIEFSDEPRAGDLVAMPQARDFGTMALACTNVGEPVQTNTVQTNTVQTNTVQTNTVQTNTVQTNTAKPIAAETPSDIHDLGEGEKSVPLDATLIGRLQTKKVALASGESETFTFVLAWHFPNAREGNAYAVRFPDAFAIADYVLDQQQRLAEQTRRWRDTYYDSTLPYWLLDRLHSTVSTLATGTCQWWANGRFYAYEGVTCCAGTCTHVWNYAHAHARLFPELTRTIREMQDFCLREEGGGFHPDTGLVGFRSNDAYAADGQCGTVLKAFREHQMSADNRFLQKLWPRIKKALEYSITQDDNADGLIENSQHNTYDINYEGANTFVGSLYLAALRAGEQMAREMEDDAFAKRCRTILDSGTRLSQQRLWNGEYFIQDVDLEKHPTHQYGKGCLSDHLFGQGWAHQLGLGYIYPREMVISALRAVWKFNWAPDVKPYNDVHKPFRWFITPGQAGLLTCTWPNSDYLPEGTVYKNEVWSGIEYQVAGHMITEGLVTEGLAICRAIHDRYDPSLINPYNEVECGDHYARAMASWGVLLALAGYEYHGPQGHLGFAPKVTPEHFKTAFTTAEGWGSFEQVQDGKVQTERIRLAWGKLQLRSLSFAVKDARLIAAVSVDGQTVPAKTEILDERLVVTLQDELVLEEGDEIVVRLS